jgi:hypothetical protein
VTGRVQLHLEERDGHFWCLTHDTWWKLCPCPGQISLTVPITQDILDATKPHKDAFRKWNPDRLTMGPDMQPELAPEPGSAYAQALHRIQHEAMARLNAEVDRQLLPAPKPEILREPLFLAWLRWQPCVVCEHLGLRQVTSSDPAHTPRTRIHGDIAVSLCRRHHDEEEQLQPAVFWAKYGIDPIARYAIQHARFELEQRTLAFG